MRKKKRTEPPAPLSDVARQKWDQLIDDLQDRGTWNDRDRHALYILATSLAQYEDAEQHIMADGSVVMGTTPIKNPFCTIQNQAWDRCQKLLTAFGLTPAARQALKESNAKPINLKDLIGG